MLGLTVVGATAQAQEKLRLPFPYIFSGPLLDFGERVWNEGVIPAVEEVNRKGGIKGKQLEFYKVDTRFPDTAQWISEFRRLCEDPSIPIVFGIGATKSLLAVFEDTKRCGMPIFNPSSGGDWPHSDFANLIFRYQPMANDVLPALYKKAASKLGVKTVTISYTLDDEATANNVRAAKKILEEQGIKILAETTFRTKESNFASQVSVHRSANPDAIILVHQPGDAGTFLLQLRERGVEKQILSDVIIGGADFWKLSQGKGKGAIGYAIYAADDPRPVVQNWVKLWRERNKKPDEAPDAFVTAYYDAVEILAKVLNASSSLTRENVRDGFLKIKGLDTISGKITWKEVGDVYRSEPVLVQVSDNGVLKYWNP